MANPPQGYVIPEFNHAPHIIPPATQTAFGAMSPTDKVKVDSIATGNQVAITGKVQTTSLLAAILSTVVLPPTPNSYAITVVVSASFADGSQSAGWIFDTGVYVDANGIAHILGTVPPLGTGPTASHGASAANWLLRFSVSGADSSFTFAVVGDATTLVNWQIAGEALPAV